MMDLRVHEQKAGGKRYPVMQQMTNEGFFYVIATLDDGQEVAIKGPYAFRETAEDKMFESKPGDLISEKTGWKLPSWGLPGSRKPGKKRKIPRPEPKKE